MKIHTEYCGRIKIIGKPNVGKSTLINNIIEEEISIVSKKKNTTQKNITGIKTKNLYQYIYIDTPGINFNIKNHINTTQTHYLFQTFKNTELIIFVVDSINWKKNDAIILNKIKKFNIPIIFIINKIDKISNKNILLPYINFIQKKINPIEIIPMSAQKKENIFFLEKIVKNYLPKNHHIFPSNYKTTNSLFFSISEIIRKQLIFFLRDELPSNITVKIASIKKNKKQITYINAIIYVNNIRHKKIVIGHRGELIKKISILSRKIIEKKININAYLFLWVKEN